MRTKKHPFTTDIDISSDDFWRKSFIERDLAFARLRAEAPVSWHPPLEVPGLDAHVHGEAGYWAIVRGVDVAFVSQNHELFSSDLVRYGNTSYRPLNPAMVPEPSFLQMDPPQHTQYRKVMSAAFTPKAVRLLQEKINSRARDIIDDVVGSGSIDFVERVSARLPMLTIADMIGVPESLVEEFARAGDNFVGFLDPDINRGEEPVAFALKQRAVLRAIGLELVAHRRNNPAEDIATALANAELGGERLSDNAIEQVMLLLSVAGNDTTKQTTSHTVIQLWGNPQQRQWLCEDFEGRIMGAIDEFIRHSSPVMTFARTATTDVELGGQLIEAGDKVVLFYNSANRDETVFDDSTLR